MVLSKTDHSENTIDIPQVGDDLVQIGNRDNKERQSVIMTCAYNSFDGDLKAPYWVQYDGVNDYKLSTHKRTWFAANGSQVTGNFKVQSDNGGLKSIEDYMKGLTTNTYKLLMSGSQFNVKADGSFSPEFISIYAYKVQGEFLTQLSPGEKVKVRVTKGEYKKPFIKEETFGAYRDKWNLFAYKEDMADVFNVELFINDNVVDMQKIHVVREGQDGRDGHSLVTKVFMEGSYRNGFTKGVKSYVKVYYDGQEVTDFKASYRYKGGGFSDWSATEIKSSDAWGDAQRDGSTLYVEYAVEYKGLKALATGRLDNIQDGKKGSDAVSYNLIPMQEAAVAYKADSGKKLVRLFLAYKIQKTVGEVTRELALGEEGIKLSVAGITKTFVSIGGAYVLDKKDVEYKETNIDTYIVTLKKGSDIVDQRIVPITFKPKVVFDIDTVNGKITSQIEAANGKINSVERDLNQTKATVGDLNEQYTQLNMKSDEISLTVNNGTRPNLLWGSDLDLSEVQDKIRLAYHNGDVIQQNTAKKEELQRQLDATPTNDTAKRNDLQKQINDCDNKITTAKKNVSECKAAIHKHLGVGIASTKIDSKEWFEYLKGGGVAGADALKFKAMKDTAEFAGLFWEINAGAARNLQLKPNTLYTLSTWVRTEFDKDAQGYANFVFEAFKKEKADSAQRVGRLSFKATSSWFEPINEWTRVSATFTTEELQYGSVAMWVNGTKPATLYICRPKLEEGDKPTPWCAYDGTTEALLASGLDIKNRKMIATTDNFLVQNNKGERTFMVDEKGALRSIDTSGKGCIVLRPEAGYISILDSETGEERVMVSKKGIFCLGVKDNNIVFDTGNERGMYAGFDMGAGMFRVNTFNDEAIGMRLDIIMNGLPYTGNNNLQYSQLYVDGKNNLKINTGEPIVKFLHPNDVYTMKYTDTTIVANTEPYRDATITLPKNPQVGMEVEIINIGTGFCYLETADDTKIFWNDVKTKETVREHTKISLLYVGGSDNLWIYTTEGVCGEKK